VPRNHLLRILRIAGFALIAYLAAAWFHSHGKSTLGLWVGGTGVLIALALLAYGGLRFLDMRKRARWELAIYRPALRAKAIAELERAAQRLLPLTHRTRAEHARLSVLAAELLDAQGEYARAIAIVDGLELVGLVPLELGLVRHTRAVIHLRASDAQGALRALAAREPSGDRELDERLILLEAYARIECGDAAAGARAAEQLIAAADAHESVLTEARVVWAAALDAQGKREEALAMMKKLGRETLEPLSELGQPRARALAEAALLQA
jgi:hypothetical protein